ncbi:uncharacterized protein LOC143019264 [Oratosquilla oratoria]|uniref:uncharacterized protein LOC143019264 n=1 Tax=Oratosquilla oratoria TaxID=337810 RepID=UPI003F774FD9
MDNPSSDRPERRTAFVARELHRLKLDIVALSETRRAREGCLREEQGNYTFFWKGLDLEQPRIHGVGFAIKNSLLPKLTEQPAGINECLMTLQIQLQKNQSTTIISAYAPTLDAEDEVKEYFYAQLDNIISSIPKNDKINLLGDFNTRVGRDHNLWKGIIGKEGVGKVNANGTLLLTKCAEHDLVITNTLFRQKNKCKVSWQHPRSKHWHLIDYVIVRARDQQDVLKTTVAMGTDDCWTDHRLISSTMSMKIRPKKKHQSQNSTKKFNVDSLQDAEKVEKLRQTLYEKLSRQKVKLSTPIEEHWNQLKVAILDTCKESIGYKTKKHQDCFDENDEQLKQLIDKKRKAFISSQNDQRSSAKRKQHQEYKAEVQKMTRNLKPMVEGQGKGNSATCRCQRLQRLLQCHQSNLWTINQWSSPTENDLPTLAEVKEAINTLKNNKAAGLDGIPAEIYKIGGNLLHYQLHQLLIKIWTNEELPSDLRDSAIITIYKKKGERSECGNYRGISLLATAGKVLARIMNNRLKPLAEKILPETQTGFRPARGTTDMIFTLRQLQEKCREQYQPLYMAFIDLTKAFYSVSRELLWNTLSTYGCPPKYIRILRLLHDGMFATVLVNNGTTDPFQVNTGVKQWCVIAPTLFIIFIATILHIIKDDLPSGIEIVYRTQGKLFNLARLKSKTKTSSCSLIEFQYADDNSIAALSEEDLQRIMNAFNKAYISLGLTINSKKTQILYQPSPNDPTRREPSIKLGETTLENVDHFPYLGSHLSSNLDLSDEIQHRLKCAGTAFGRLRNRIFQDHDIRTDTKMAVYNAVVIPTLLYASETWTTYRRHLDTLEKFHQRCLRSILNISWEDRRTNVSVLKAAKATSIEAHIIKSQLR